MILPTDEQLFTWPIKSPHIITAGWCYNDGSLHRAIDLRGITGVPVYAAADGIVTTTITNWSIKKGILGSNSYGNYIKIKHTDKYNGRYVHTLYAHLSRVICKKSDVIREGDLIGYVGNTGNSFGSHLHFEVLYNGTRVNPLNWLDSDFTCSNDTVARCLGNYKSVIKPNDYYITMGPVSAGDYKTFVNLAEKLKVKYERK